METAYKSLKLIIGALLLLPMLWAASCSMLFGGAAYAVKEAAGPDSDSAYKQDKRAELRRHNEQMNREAGYGSRSGYDYEDGY